MGLIHINIEENIKNEVRRSGFNYHQVFMRGVNNLRAETNPEINAENLKIEMTKKIERLSGLLNRYTLKVSELEDEIKNIRNRGY